MTARSGNWMLTAAGRRYWPADPRVEEVYVEDLAAHLAKLCRFTGACRELYVVGEHSCHVEQLVREMGGDRRTRRQALFHDGPEAYINDINRPTKHGPRMEGYHELEDLNWRVVAERFDVPYELDPLVKLADHYMLFHEAAAIMPPMPDEIKEAWGMGLGKPPVLRPEMIQCWHWRQARSEFLNRYEEVR